MEPTLPTVFTWVDDAPGGSDRSRRNIARFENSRTIARSNRSKQPPPLLPSPPRPPPRHVAFFSVDRGRLFEFSWPDQATS